MCYDVHLTISLFVVLWNLRINVKAVDNTTGVLQEQSEFLFYFILFFVDDSFMKGILGHNFEKKTSDNLFLLPMDDLDFQQGSFHEKIVWSIVRCTS